MRGARFFSRVCYVLCMHGRLIVLRVHTHIMGSRGYPVLRHAIMAQGTLECNIVLLYVCFFVANLLRRQDEQVPTCSLNRCIDNTTTTTTTTTTTITTTTPHQFSTKGLQSTRHSFLWCLLVPNLAVKETVTRPMRGSTESGNPGGSIQADSHMCMCVCM